MAFWDTEETPVVISKNNRNEEIHVKKVSKSGKEFVDVRTFYDKDGIPTPGKGISIPLNIVEEVLTAISEVK